MSRYIDPCILAWKLESGKKYTAGEVRDLINDAPAADVKEVVRGKWIHIGENSTGNIFMCSACDHCVNPNKKDVKSGRADEKTNFCPHCGADMGVE